MTLPKDFYRNIEKLTSVAKHTNSPRQIFQDLIQVAFNSITDSRMIVRMPHLSTGWEPKLRRELTAYKTQPEAWALVSETVQIWFEAIKASQPFEDVFGSAYDEHLGKTLGQFFTPPDVSYAIAGFNMAISRDTLAEQLKAGEGIVFGDTCGCGGGSLLLAQIRCFYEEFGAKALHMVCVQGQDLDESMVQLAATQLYFAAAFHNIQIGVIAIRHGNTLTEPDAPYGFLSVFDPERTQAQSAWKRDNQARTPEPAVA